jgi:hypothetical protein
VASLRTRLNLAGSRRRQASYLSRPRRLRTSISLLLLGDLDERGRRERSATRSC